MAYRSLLLTGLLSATFGATAQPGAEPANKPKCISLQAATTQLQKKFGEIPVAFGIADREKGGFILFATPDGRGWSLLRTPDLTGKVKPACDMLEGTDLKFHNPAGIGTRVHAPASPVNNDDLFERCMNSDDMSARLNEALGQVRVFTGRHTDKISLSIFTTHADHLKKGAFSMNNSFTLLADSAGGTSCIIGHGTDLSINPSMTLKPSP